MATTLSTEQRVSYTVMIDDILSKADINSVSAKAIRSSMQERIDYDITPQKSAITELIMERFDKVAPAQPAHPPAPPKTNGYHKDIAKKRKAEDDAGDSELSDVDSEPAPKKVKKSKVKPETESDEAFAAKLQAQLNAQARSTRGGGVVKKKSPVKREKKPKKKSAAKIGSDDDSEVEAGTDSTKERKGGFHKLMNLSAPLAALVGEPALSRPQTVKKIWEYVKAHDLQDPGDKRQIRCDEAMFAVFKQDRVHMFTMNKILATQLYPIEE